MVVVPYFVSLSIEVIVAGIDDVGGYVGVEMMDVVVLDSVGEGT